MVQEELIQELFMAVLICIRHCGGGDGSLF